MVCVVVAWCKSMTKQTRKWQAPSHDNTNKHEQTQLMLSLRFVYRWDMRAYQTFYLHLHAFKITVRTPTLLLS